MVFRSLALRSLGAAALALALLAGDAAAEVYRLDRSHSSVSFSIRHLVSRVGGHFSDFDVTVHFDADKPGSLKAEATIQAASIDTDNERRDNHLRSADFFEVEKYPTIVFQSTGARKEGEKIMLDGTLTMHGVTRPVTLEVEVTGTSTHPRNGAPMLGLEAMTTIKRSEFGVNNWTDAAGVLSDEVQVVIALAAMGPVPEEKK